jgi:transposase-like protein
MAKYNKEALLADYHTGQYTIRELADKHKISRSTVGNITNGLDKKNKELIDKKVEVIQASALLTGQELDAVNHSVQFKIDLLRDIERFSNKAMAKANDLITNSDTGSDFKAVIEGVDKLSVMTKINNRHAPPASIQQNTQNNAGEQITRVFHVVE